MFLRSAVGGWVMVGMLVVAAGAQELLPAGVTNVALPDFGNRIGEPGDYGLANVDPVEVTRGVNGEAEIRLFRTPRELRLPRLGEARFQVRLGDIEFIVFWIESPPVLGAWRLNAKVIYPDGLSEPLFGQNLLINGHYHLPVPPRTTVEFSISFVLLGRSTEKPKPEGRESWRVISKERETRNSRRFRFTVTPATALLERDFIFYPFSSVRGVGP